MAIATLTIDMVAKLANLERDMGKAAQIAEANAKRMEAAFAGVGKTLATLGAGISVGAFVGLVRGLADSGDALAKLSARTGDSVEELSKLQYAASLADTSNETLGKGLTRLNRVMGDAANGVNEAQGSLARFGIDPGSKLSTVEAFNQIADRVKATGDETKIASGLNAIFGRSFAEMIPLLKGGSGELKAAGDELERMGGVMSGELSRSSEAFNDNITRLSKKMEALKIDAIGPLIPLLLEISGAMAQTSEKSNELSVSGQALKTIFETIAVLGANVAYVFKGVGNEIGGVAAQVVAISRLDFKAFSAIGAAMRDDAAKARKDIDALTDRLLNPSPVASGGKGAGPAILDTPQKIKELKLPKAKKENYTDLLTPAAEAYAKAIQAVNAAQLSADKSTLKLSASESALYDLIQSPLWEQFPEAWKAVVIAQTDAGTASEKVANDFKRLQDLIDSTPTAKLEDMRGKMLLLADALESGKINPKIYDEAVAKLNEVKDAGKDMAEQLRDAIDGWGKDAARSIVDFAMTGKTSFSDMARSIIADMARMVVQQNITGPLASSVGGWAKGLFETNARGGVYADSGLSAYSNSIVSSPTVFPFARGIGLMGEAGPEAIIPLKRSKDGSLGIAGGGGGGVEVNVINNANGTQATQTTRQDAGGKTIIDVLVEQIKGAIASDISKGGTVATAMESQYALNRAAGAWR